jgi:hypothetical protein
MESKALAVGLAHYQPRQQLLVRKRPKFPSSAALDLSSRLEPWTKRMEYRSVVFASGGQLQRSVGL